VNLTLIPVPTGYIHGKVTLSGGFGIIQQVLVTAGPHTTHPDQNGDYILTVTPGTYDVIATLSAYIPDTVLNVSVANQQTVNGVNLTLVLAPTNGLMTGTVTPERRNRKRHAGFGHCRRRFCFHKSQCQWFLYA
jgi:hypothetical protein